MSKWINRAFVVTNIALFIVAGYFLFIQRIIHPPGEIEFKDAITIVLTALAVILAALTIFVALVAIWGYNAIREAAEKAADLAAREVAKSVAKDVAQAVASREAMRFPSVLGETPDIKAAAELTAELKAGDSEAGGGDEK